MIGTILKTVIGPILGPLVEKIPDPNERHRLKAQAEAQIIEAVARSTVAQIEVNREAAKHSSIFVAGARPFILWVCGFALAWEFILRPMVVWIAFLSGVDVGSAPELNADDLFAVLTGLLGLGGLRTYEKKLGVARSAIGEVK